MKGGNLKLDAATGLLHSIPPGRDFTDCGLMVRKLKDQDQVSGKVKEAKACPDCEVQRTAGTRSHLLGVE